MSGHHSEILTVIIGHGGARSYLQIFNNKNAQYVLTNCINISSVILGNKSTNLFFRLSQGSLRGSRQSRQSYILPNALGPFKDIFSLLMSPDHLSGANMRRGGEEAGGAASSASELWEKDRKCPVSVKEVNANLGTEAKYSKMMGKGKNMEKF